MGKTVMVVDDSLFVFEEMRYLLSGTGFEIVSYCKSGEEAVAAYDIIKPDVVTMDIILPGMDGMEATELLIKKDPKANIVVVSSLAYDDMVEQAKRLGAKEFIFKPFEREHIIQALARAADIVL